jgi:hypothetical protein
MEAFIDHQYNPTTSNNSFYPFTEVNPNYSWIKKIRISIFGETAIERGSREELRDQIYNYWMP